jgi:SCP-2 sterol transfer family
VQLWLDYEPFTAVVPERNLELKRGEIHDPDVVISTRAATLLDLVREERKLDEEIAAGKVEVAADPDAATRFHTLFAAP